MKFVLVFFFVAIVAINADDKYTTKFDDIDLDEILSNQRLVKQHHECLMDRGPCTKELVELKKVLTDALETDCSKCSDKQRDGAKKVIKTLYDKYRPNYDELKGKYDPEGKYIQKYRADIEKEGYKV